MKIVSVLIYLTAEGTGQSYFTGQEIPVKNGGRTTVDKIEESKGMVTIYFKDGAAIRYVGAPYSIEFAK